MILNPVILYTKIYGAEWEGGEDSAWTRTNNAVGLPEPSPAVNNGSGSSPFDSIMPWAGMQKVEDDVGTLVQIPKYYYRWTRTGAKMRLQICAEPHTGFHVPPPPAHADRGDGAGERDFVYVGRYHCSNTYKSQSGVLPVNSLARATARSGIHNLGAAYWQYDFAMYWTIMMLYLVEYANWNSQETIGYGCSPDGVTFNVGMTDFMRYHTGTTAASRDEYGCCQYRHIEGLWDNRFDWCDGIYFSATNIYCINNPSRFSDTSGGTLVGERAQTNGYISAWTAPTADGFEYALYPSSCNGSETTYICDYSIVYYTGVALYVGGNQGQNQNRGAFCMIGNAAADSLDISISCRLMKLP